MNKRKRIRSERERERVSVREKEREKGKELDYIASKMRGCGIQAGASNEFKTNKSIHYNGFFLIKKKFAIKDRLFVCLF